MSLRTWRSIPERWHSAAKSLIPRQREKTPGNEPTLLLTELLAGHEPAHPQRVRGARALEAPWILARVQPLRVGTPALRPFHVWFMGSFHGWLRGQWFSPLALLICHLWVGQASAAPIVVRDVLVPVFLRHSPSAAAVIRIETLSQGYQRKGFFRIGFLPTAIADGVRIEIRRPAEATEALAAAASAVRTAGKGKSMELRRVSLHVTPEAKPLLEAGLLEFGATGEWQFTRGVVFQTPTNVLRLDRVALVTSGPQAGQVEWGRSHSLPLLDCLAAAKTAAGTEARKGSQ